jgi:LDH2 family malate/lactate/ureidoglycolate dehydrogenase
MAAQDPCVPAEALKAFTTAVFTKAGLPAEWAETQADMLVWANLRGVDSHGVLRIPAYVSWIDKGLMKTKANLRVEKETPGIAIVDADYAPGPVAGVLATRRVIEKARKIGIGWAVIRNAMHLGAIGYYVEMIANQGMAGLFVTCNPPNMAPYGAKAPGVHNSPLAIGVPGKRHRPVILDMATSVAAGGKVSLAVDKGIPIPLGWALDKQGNPTTDPKQGTTLMPFGGYKGSGMAFLFECLTGLFVGNPLLLPVFQGKPGATDHRQNSLVAAVDIATFTELEQYKQTVDETAAGIKALPKSEGSAEVFVPGEPEDRVREQRAKDGIPLPAGTVSNMRSVAERFGVALPAGL